MENSQTPQAHGARLLMQHRTALYAYVYATLRNRHDTEDVLQEVSVAVIESIERLRSDEGFLPWAREIARRRILAHRRTHGLRIADPELLIRLAEAAERVETARPTGALREAMMACLDELPQPNRKVMLTRYGESGNRLYELAQELGRSMQAVYALIKRTKVALRACIERRMAAETSP